MILSLRTFRSVGAILLAAALSTACSAGDDAAAGDAAAGASAPAASASAGDDLADITNYRLTMERVDQYMAAQRNLALKSAELSPEEREAIRQRTESDADDASLDVITSRIEAEPVMVEAIREAGLSPREFTLITMSMVQSGMAASVLQMRPEANRDSLIRAMQANPENVQFFVEHQAEITRKQQELQAEMQRLGIMGDEGEDAGDEDGI